MAFIKDGLLVSAGTELFRVSGTVICFGLRSKTMLITHRFL